MDINKVLLNGLTDRQKEVVNSNKSRLLVIAGAGSGKTEVMARRVAWWVAVDGVPKESIVAFTFTERAAEEMKFRIRQYIERITPDGEDVTLGGMYIGTIHAFCLKMLRELKPGIYHNFDVIDDAARLALVQRGYSNLGLKKFSEAINKGQFAAVELFLKAYDLLNEYNELDVKIPSETAPHSLEKETDWCMAADLKTNVGSIHTAKLFGTSVARYYAYLRCRRFFDFSTSQSELIRLLRRDTKDLFKVRSTFTHVVVDEVQDINPVQDELIRLIVGDAGSLTAVGDHRQAIYAWRGGRVDLMAALYDELRNDPDGAVIELDKNFRSTPRIVKIANTWADTISKPYSMGNPKMEAGNNKRLDLDSTHVATLSFLSREQEAKWIAHKIKELVKTDGTGALHDTKEKERGISYTDIAVLIRSSTDARTYMTALEREGIPAVFRAGPDLFSQPEVLLFIAALARIVGIDQFFGENPKSLPKRIDSVLKCEPTPEAVIRASCSILRKMGLIREANVEDRILVATHLINNKIYKSVGIPMHKLKQLKSFKLIKFLQGTRSSRRVFPQTLYHYLLEEAGVAEWETVSARGGTAMFHLGQLSTLVKGIETPGWTSVDEFKYQIIALYTWGSQNARTEEAPLLVQPDAVTISTIHSVKGLEFTVVFLADVNSQRFPSSRAKIKTELPFDGPILKRIDPANLADNDNYDGERRLMYVALTRAERYLFVTSSGSRRSQFFKEVQSIISSVGGSVNGNPENIPSNP